MELNESLREEMIDFSFMSSTEENPSKCCFIFSLHGKVVAKCLAQCLNLKKRNSQKFDLLLGGII